MMEFNFSLLSAAALTCLLCILHGRVDIQAKPSVQLLDEETPAQILEDTPSVNQPPRVAVCVKGLVRTFERVENQRNWAKYFHQPGFEYFLSTERRVNVESFTNIVGPVRDQTIVNTSRHVPRERECFQNKTKMHFYILPMIIRQEACAPMIEAFERSGNFTYDFVYVTRTDYEYLGPWPSIEFLLSLTPSAPISAERQLFGRNDHRVLLKQFFHLHDELN